MQFLHQLECTDAKGKKSVISGARFVIAVGGRPSPLQVQICACASSILLPYSLNLFTSAFFPPSLLYLRIGLIWSLNVFSLPLWPQLIYYLHLTKYPPVTHTRHFNLQSLFYIKCPGAEFALSSDDIFMKQTPPGKTCVVGAGYVLEYFCCLISTA